MIRSLFPPSTVVGVLLFAASTRAHGIATAIIKDDGTFYKGYNPSYQYENPQPVVVQWSTPDDLQNTFVGPSGFTTWDIACHLGATPAGLAIPVKGGDVLNIQWDTWPDSHKGPIIDMLAKCDGACSTADKETLKFFKISELALVDAASDYWAPNMLIKNKFNWQVTIPSDIVSGNYVLRHEIIALHAAGQLNGAQAYPFCFNLAVDNPQGTLEPEGVLATALYSPEDPGIHYDLFSNDGTYEIPGPPMYGGSNVAIEEQGAAPAVRATSTGVASYVVQAAPTPTPEQAAEPETPTVTEPASDQEEESPEITQVGEPIMVTEYVDVVVEVTESVKTTLTTVIYNKRR